MVLELFYIITEVVMKIGGNSSILPRSKDNSENIILPLVLYSIKVLA